MLSVEDNEALTHVGPGTVMGDLLRQYWVPALLSEELPELDLGDLVYSPNIGAYTHASSTHFNGFPPATVVHVNQ